MPVEAVKSEKKTVFIPEDDEFEGEDEFLKSSDLVDLAYRLIESKATWLQGRSVAFLWKKTGGNAKGKPRLGTCQKPTGLLKHFADYDFVIWLGADNMRAAKFGQAEIEATLYHELCHAWIDEDGDPQVLPHDYEGFCSEMKEYGLWRPDLRQMHETTKQMKLF